MKKITRITIVVFTALLISGCKREYSEEEKLDMAYKVIDKYDFYDDYELEDDVTNIKTIALTIPKSFTEQDMSKQATLLSDVLNDISDNTKDKTDFTYQLKTVVKEDGQEYTVHSVHDNQVVFVPIDVIYGSGGTRIAQTTSKGYGLSSFTPEQLIYGVMDKNKAPLDEQQQSELAAYFQKLDQDNIARKKAKSNARQQEVEDSWTVTVDGVEKKYWELTKEQQEQYVEQKFGTKSE